MDTVKVYTNKAGDNLWTAYCLDCKAVVTLSNGERVQWENGQFVEAAARIHIAQQPTHQVIVGLTYYKE
jgi:hypothetical protein